MLIQYVPTGVCAQKIEIELEGDTIVSVEFLGGCNGNGQGIAALAQGMKVQDYIQRCRGIQCKSKPTSCPAQLAQALEEALASAADGMSK